MTLGDCLAALALHFWTSAWIITTGRSRRARIGHARVRGMGDRVRKSAFT
jgi:hypothetical protein